MNIQFDRHSCGLESQWILLNWPKWPSAISCHLLPVLSVQTKLWRWARGLHSLRKRRFLPRGTRASHSVCMCLPYSVGHVCSPDMQTYIFSLSLARARALSLSRHTRTPRVDCSCVHSLNSRNSPWSPPPSHGQSKRRLRGQMVACLAYPGSSGGSFPPLLDTARSPPKNQTRNSHHNGNQNRKWSKSTGLRPFIRPHITTKYQIWRENTLVAGLWLLGHGRIMQIM
jgi:hypothetical protein